MLSMLGRRAWLAHRSANARCPVYVLTAAAAKSVHLLTWNKSNMCAHAQLAMQNVYDAFSLYVRTVLKEFANFYSTFFFSLSCHTASRLLHPELLRTTGTTPWVYSRMAEIQINVASACGVTQRSVCTTACKRGLIAPGRLFVALMCRLKHWQVYAEASFADLQNVAAFTCVQALGGVVYIPDECQKEGISLRVCKQACKLSVGRPFLRNRGCLQLACALACTFTPVLAVSSLLSYVCLAWRSS